MIYKNNLKMDSAEKKDDELVTMQNPDMKDQFSPNIQPSKYSCNGNCFCFK